MLNDETNTDSIENRPHPAKEGEETAPFAPILIEGGGEGVLARDLLEFQQTTAAADPLPTLEMSAVRNITLFGGSIDVLSPAAKSNGRHNTKPQLIEMLANGGAGASIKLSMNRMMVRAALGALRQAQEDGDTAYGAENW